METAPVSCQKATRHRLLWLAGTRGIAQLAVPGCPRLWWLWPSPSGCMSPPPPCPSPHISCLRSFCLSPHTWREVSFLCQGEHRLSYQAVPRLKLGPSRAAKGLPWETSPSQSSPAALQVPQPRVLQGCASAQFLAGMKEGIFGLEWNQGILSSSCPKVRHHMAGKEFTLMLGVMWAPCHQGKLWDRGDEGCSNSCRK